MQVRARTVRLAGLTRPLAAMLSGGLLVLASPPRDGWPLALVSLVPLWWAIRGVTPRGAFGLGWLAGLVHHGLGNAWWFTVLARAADLPPWARLLLTLLICAWQALVLGIWAGSVSLLADRFRVRRLLAAPLAIALAETAVPYLIKWHLGIAAWRIWPVLQAAELGGPVAVSAVLVLSSGVTAELITDLRRWRRAGREAVTGLLVLLAVLGAGSGRGLYVDAARGAAPKRSVGLVQSNHSLYQKAEAGAEEEPEARRQRIRQVLGRASTILLAQGTDLVVWPETAWPETLPRLQPGEPGPRFLRTLLTGFDGRLLFGAVTRGEDGARYNSAFLLAPAGEVEATHDKNRPFPFYEYLPFADRWPQWAQPLRQRLRRQDWVRPGEALALATAGDLRLGVLICSEEILPHHAAAVARLRPNLLVGIASDRWAHGTVLPVQHTANAVARAVESRRDFIHVADDGRSVLVDATGRVRAAVAGQRADEPVASLRGEVALLEISSPGPYAVALFPWACLLTLVLAAVGGGRRRPKRSENEAEVRPNAQDSA